MNFKTKIYIGGYYIFFSLYWLLCNWNSLKHLDNTIGTLLHLTTSGAGFNSAMLHGTVYALLFLLILNDQLVTSKEQYLVRQERKKFLHDTFKINIIVSLLFNFIFISTSLVLTMIFQDFELLIKSKYFIGVLISFVINSVYYVFVGAVFCLIYTILFSKTRALLFSFISMVVLSVMCLIYRIWTPIIELFIYDSLYCNKLSVLDVVFKFVRIVILIGFIHYVTFQIFKEKDVLRSEDL